MHRTCFSHTLAKSMPIVLVEGYSWFVKTVSVDQYAFVSSIKMGTKYRL